MTEDETDLFTCAGLLGKVGTFPICDPRERFLLFDV